MILPHLKPGNLVVLESTSPPRTTAELVLPILERSGLRAGADFSLVYCPERVLPGQILKELVENARVVGGITPASAQAGRELYASFVTGEIYLTDATTAEMVKLMENTYRDVNIAIANQFFQAGGSLWGGCVGSNFAGQPPSACENSQPGAGRWRALHQRRSVVFCRSRAGPGLFDLHRA